MHALHSLPHFHQFTPPTEHGNWFLRSPPLFIGRIFLMTTAESLELSDQDKVQLWNSDSGMESMTDSNKDVTPVSENFDEDEEVCQLFFRYKSIFYVCRFRRMKLWANVCGRLPKCSQSLYEKTLASSLIPLAMWSSVRYRFPIYPYTHTIFGRLIIKYFQKLIHSRVLQHGTFRPLRHYYLCLSYLKLNAYKWKKHRKIIQNK